MGGRGGHLEDGGLGGVERDHGLPQPAPLVALEDGFFGRALDSRCVSIDTHRVRLADLNPTKGPGVRGAVRVGKVKGH